MNRTKNEDATADKVKNGMWLFVGHFHYFFFHFDIGAPSTHITQRVILKLCTPCFFGPENPFLTESAHQMALQNEKFTTNLKIYSEVATHSALIWLKIRGMVLWTRKSILGNNFVKITSLGVSHAYHNTWNFSSFMSIYR